MNSFSDTLREGLQYRAKSGQWAWLFHRVSGSLTVVFIVTHVLDSTLITFFPKLYSKTIQLFKLPLAGLGEIGLIGAVLYHAVNGLKVAILDMNPRWWRHQKKADQLVQLGFGLLFIPIAVKMLVSVLAHLGKGER